MIDHNWILGKLEEKGLYQKDLGTALGIAKSQITRMLQGERNIQIHEIPRILAFLDEKPPYIDKVYIRIVLNSLAKNSDWIQMDPDTFEELVMRLIEHVAEEDLSKDHLDVLTKFQEVG